MARTTIAGTLALLWCEGSPVIYGNLNPAKALIWRIMHRSNLDWVLDHGLHCANSPARASGWVDIGNAELIAKRASHPVPLAPGGTLNDYVPFYFTPFSIMLANIGSGRNGIVKRAGHEIVMVVSSLHRLAALELPFLFTDKHAYFHWTRFFDELAHLDQIDWALLQQRDFRRDPDDPDKIARYQAEALVHRHVPLNALLGIVCATEQAHDEIIGKISSRGLPLAVHTRPDWFFR